MILMVRGLLALAKRRQGKEHSRSLSGFAVDMEFAAMEFRKGRGDREAEARSLMPARIARLYLSEGRHRICDLLFRHADAGIGDGDRRAFLGRPRSNEHDAPAFRRKLVRVGKQVDQHLLDTAYIDGHLRQDRVGLDFQHLLLLADARFDKHDTGIDQLPEGAILLRELEGPALDFRNVEDVRDDIEQVAAGARYMGSI